MKKAYTTRIAKIFLNGDWVTVGESKSEAHEPANIFTELEGRKLIIVQPSMHPDEPAKTTIYVNCICKLETIHSVE